MTGPETRRTARSAAAAGLNPFSTWRSTASTTIASSTTSPIASATANMVRMIMENPGTLTAANVPISATGMSDARALARTTGTTGSAAAHRRR